MSKYDTQTPYIASYIIIRRDNKIAFVLRSNTKWMNGFYSLPSGKIEKGENFSVGAAREAYEEAGIKVNPEDLDFVHITHRHDETDWVDIYFEAKNYEGEPYNAEPESHGELIWFDPKNLPNKVLDYVKVTLSHIEDGNKYSEYSWPAS